jgi:hypothetical protein
VTSLRDELHADRAPPDELVTVFGFFFGSSRWESGRAVEYLDGEGVALRVLYDKRGYGIQDIERGPTLTDERFSELQVQIERDILTDHGTVIHRDFFFSAIRVELVAIRERVADRTGTE